MVSGVFDALLDSFAGDRLLRAHREGLCGKVDVRLVHARNPAHRTLDGGCAVCAVHPTHLESLGPDRGFHRIYAKNRSSAWISSRTFSPGRFSTIASLTQVSR